MLLNLATVAADANLWQESAAAWRQALALRPQGAAAFRAAAAAFQRANEPEEAARALASAAERDPTNWQHHYAHAHALMMMAAEAAAKGGTTEMGDTAGRDGTLAGGLGPDALPRDIGTTGTTGGGARAGNGFGDVADPPNPPTPSILSLEQRALSALAPLSRDPISLHARHSASAAPLWMRDNGRGVRSDGPLPRTPADLLAAQAGRRAEAEKAGRQRGVIVYKLGGSDAEIDNLKMSMWRLDRWAPSRPHTFLQGVGLPPRLQLNVSSCPYNPLQRSVCLCHP
jgi:tetratricopeptide (TPR) repeat protein